MKHDPVDHERLTKERCPCGKFSDHRSGHDELLDTDESLDKLRWLRYQMLDVMDFTEQTDDGDFVAAELFGRLDEYIKRAESLPVAEWICKVPGCRWNTHRVCDSYCRECRAIIRKAKERKACGQK